MPPVVADGNCGFEGTHPPSSEQTVYQTARKHIQEDSKRPNNRCDSLSSHILLEYQAAMFKSTFVTQGDRFFCQFLSMLVGSDFILLNALSYFPFLGNNVIFYSIVISFWIHFWEMVIVISQLHNF